MKCVCRADLPARETYSRQTAVEAADRLMVEVLEVKGRVGERPTPTIRAPAAIRQTVAIEARRKTPVHVRLASQSGAP